MMYPSTAITYIGTLIYGSPKLYFDKVYFCCNIFIFIGITLTAKHLEADFALVYASLFMTSKKPMFPSIN